MKRTFLLLILFIPLLASAADWYLNSVSGADGNSGANWANAKSKLTNVLALMAAGDTCYVTNGHTETIGANTTLTNAGTAASPLRIICVSDAGVPPTTLATGAVFAVSGNNTLSISIGPTYWYGWTFNGSTNNNSTADLVLGVAGNPFWGKFERCQLNCLANNSAGTLQIGGNSSSPDEFLVEWVNCLATIGHSGSGIQVRGPFIWRNSADVIGSAVGGTSPTSLFLQSANSDSGPAWIDGVDLSALGSGKNVVDLSLAVWTSYRFSNCKLGDGASLITGNPSAQGGQFVSFVNCSSAATNYSLYQQFYQGTNRHEITIICTNNASDGTTPMSRRMSTTANSKTYSPLRSDPISVWNETTNQNISVTLPIINDGLTLSNQHAWIEVEFLGNGDFPISTTTNNTVNELTAGTALTTDSTSQWKTNGLAAPIKQQMSVTINPKMKGVIRVFVNLARASTTMYYGPLIIERTGSGRQYQLPYTYINESFGREHSSVF